VALVFVSVGSNVERERHVRGALAALRRRFGPLLISSVYETPAVGFDGDPFYNLVVAFVTAQPAREVAATMHTIEAEHGRVHGSERFGPRTLDLDLLLYGDTVLHEDGLDLPRPEITHHAFVLQPLAEIASDVPHPASGRHYGELWSERRHTLSADGGTRIALRLDE